MKIYVHALGGGHGHLVRARGLARALLELGDDVVVGAPGDHPGRAALEREGISTLPLWPGRARSQIAATLGSGVDRLVVDALPQGVEGELAPLPFAGPTILVRRLLRRPESAASYARIVDVEPLETSPAACGPVVYPSPAPAEARVVLVGGDDLLDDLLARLAARLTRAGVANRLHLRRKGDGRGDPLGAVPLAGAACVVGAAGYHLVHEARALGVPHLAIPRPRRFDDQRLRAARFARTPTSPEALLEDVMRALDGRWSRAPVPPRTAVELAEAVLRA